MRASIPALAVLAIIAAEALNSGFGASRPEHRRAAWLIVIVLAIGSATGLGEIWRALANHPSPLTQCSLLGSWDQQVGLLKVSNSTYLAPVASLPSWMQAPPAGRVAGEDDPEHCWPRPWRVPR